MDRPVPYRTDKSAETFWCRERDQGHVSPDGKVLHKFSANAQMQDKEQNKKQDKKQDHAKVTPFGRQHKPTSHFPSMSREVERKVLCLEIKNGDEFERQHAFVRKLIQQNMLLRKENQLHNEELRKAWKINKALAHTLMARNY